jgi:hypothetical protein
MGVQQDDERTTAGGVTMLTPFTMRKALIPLTLLLAGLMIVGHAPANPQSAAQAQAAQYLKALQAAQKAAQAEALKIEKAAQKAAQAQAAQNQKALHAAQKAAQAEATQVHKAEHAALIQAIQAARLQHTLHKLEKKHLEAAVGQIVNELHATKTLLEMADHDYKGHRAAAVHELDVAIKELGGHKGKGPAGNNEPQALSDAQLKAAVLGLVEIEEQLSTVPAPATARAAAAVAVAVKELKKALTIR